LPLENFLALAGGSAASRRFVAVGKAAFHQFAGAVQQALAIVARTRAVFRRPPAALWPCLPVPLAFAPSRNVACAPHNSLPGDEPPAQIALYADQLLDAVNVDLRIARRLSTSSQPTRPPPSRHRSTSRQRGVSPLSPLQGHCHHRAESRSTACRPYGQGACAASSRNPASSSIGLFPSLFEVRFLRLRSSASSSRVGVSIARCLAVPSETLHNWRRVRVARWSAIARGPPAVVASWSTRLPTISPRRASTPIPRQTRPVRVQIDSAAGCAKSSVVRVPRPTRCLQNAVKQRVGQAPGRCRARPGYLKIPNQKGTEINAGVSDGRPNCGALELRKI